MANRKQRRRLAKGAVKRGLTNMYDVEAGWEAEGYVEVEDTGDPHLRVWVLEPVGRRAEVLHFPGCCDGACEKRTRVTIVGGDGPTTTEAVADPA